MALVVPRLVPAGASSAQCLGAVGTLSLCFCLLPGVGSGSGGGEVRER